MLDEGPGMNGGSDRSGKIGVLENRWTLRILLLLLNGQMRFSDFQRALPGISAKILTLRLRELEAERLVTRGRAPPPSASGFYGLSVAAKGLRPALHRLARWLDAGSNDRSEDTLS